MNRALGRLLLACLSLTGAGTACAQDVVRLGNLRFAHYGAVSYMQEICPKHGLRIEERLFAKGADIMPAVVAGQIDVAALAADGAIAARANNVPIYAVAGFAKGGARIVVRADAGIRSLKDLKGRRVGVTRGGGHELLLYAELEKAGLSWSEKGLAQVTIVFLPYEELNGALADGRIDAMSQSEPQSAQAINKKIGVELLKPYDTAVGEPRRLLVMTEKFYARRPLAEKLLRCFVEATAALNNDPALAERYVREQLFKGALSAQDYRDAMANADYTVDVTPEYIDATTRLMQRYGVGRMSRPPKAAEWVKLDLLARAKAEAKSGP